MGESKFRTVISVHDPIGNVNWANGCGPGHHFWIDRDGIFHNDSVLMDGTHIQESFPVSLLLDDEEE